MAEEQTIGTCLICKHALVLKLNIFKTRTNFSKTLVSSKLSKLVQATFRQEAMLGAQDICSSCSALINQVDECEIKLMALENEVKLKYKMPFPIEVHSRRSDTSAPQPGPGPPGPGPAPSRQAPLPQVEPPVERIADSATVAPPDDQSEQHDSQPPSEQEFSFISIDGSALENPTIVLEAGEVDVDGNNVVVYREPYGEQTLSYDPSMSYLAQLEASSLHEGDVTGAEHVALDHHPGQRKRQTVKRRRTSQDGLSCDFCDETFSSAASLRSHKACHVNDKSFPCRFCQRVFSTNIALHFHWNEEHPLKLQPCLYCDKRFINKSNLNQHINTHLEPRFSCEMTQCGRQFHTRGDLRKHMVFKHSTVKNFQCPECDLSFKVNWLLTRHRVRVHNQA